MLEQNEEERAASARGVEPLEYLPRLVSGAQPSTQIHLGHYFGALKQHIQLQHEYPGQIFICIADYHALTVRRAPGELRTNTTETATSYLALGLDAYKCVLYRQSDVPLALELYWILSCLAPTGELSRVPTFKEADTRAKSAGLLTYPVLMAADILGLRATHVPVGADQTINLERVRALAEDFRTLHGPMLPLPRMLHGPQRKIPGIDGRKMSATHDNIIALFDEFPELRTRVMSIRTSPAGARDPKDPEKCIVFYLYSLVAPAADVELMRDRYVSGGISYVDAKRALISAIQEYFEPSWTRYRELKKQSDFVWDILRDGMRAASLEVELTVDAVRNAIGL
jgi:tryptophanyl-tRNA synthetase